MVRSGLLYFPLALTATVSECKELADDRITSSGPLCGSLRELGSRSHPHLRDLHKTDSRIVEVTEDAVEKSGNGMWSGLEIAR